MSVPALPSTIADQQWAQARDAEALAMQEAAENAVLALINATTKAAQAVHALFCPKSPADKEKENDCTKEIEECSELCADAMTDPDREHVYGGSMTQCMKNCLPERCGGEPLWKGYKK